jgi:aminocarboxymuconate-semialdehyde decarboxylase
MTVERRRDERLNIDVHTHYLPRSVVAAADGQRDWHGIRFGLNEKGQLVSTTEKLGFALPWPDFRAPITDRIAAMDRLRIDMHLLSLTPTLWRHELDARDGIDMARDVNDETAAIVADHPDRFGGFAFLPLQDADASVGELERAVGELGLVGAAVSTHVDGEDWDSERLFPVLEAANDLGALLFVHPSAVRARKMLDKYHLFNMIGNPLETTVAIGSIIFGGVLDRLTDLRLVFAHGGGYAAFAAGRFDHGATVRPESRGTQEPPADYLQRLYFDDLTHSPLALRYLIDLVGIEHVVLGSDFPADMGYVDPVGWLERAPLIDDAEKARILGGNVEDLLGLRVAEPLETSA